LAPPGPVADLGCGPGHVARHLHDLGREVIGIDLSPGMVETARRASPGPDYRVGDLLALDLPDGSLGGAIVFYAIVHLAPADLARPFAELRRVLRPDGLALVSFHAGGHVVHADELFGVDVSLDFHFHAPAGVRRALEAAGLSVEWDVRRGPVAGEVQTDRCYLLARRGPISLRPASDADREFLRALHHACLRPWVEPTWGWDESDQDRRFDAAFATDGRSIVELEGRPVGTLRLGRDERGLRVDDVEVAPGHQGRGIGTRLLRDVLAEADREGLPVRLRVLRTSPARRLYLRLGFAVEGETDTHVLMARELA
jgi:SAM-dependent methyltransferase